MKWRAIAGAAIFWTWSAVLAAQSAPGAQPTRPGENLLVTQNPIGRYGGRLVVALRAEPRTFNPVTSVDLPSREVIPRLMADLIHINRGSQRTEPALARSWRASADGRRYVLKLRRGVRFSDGQPFDADDVVFSFEVYLDEKVASPQRDLLMVGGKPIQVRKLGPYTVAFEISQPYAAAERLFDSVSILPRHVLEGAYRQGKINQSWGLNTPPQQIVGLGPFRLKEYVPGQRITLERNPYYWKADSRQQRLPYLDEITFQIIPSEDAQVLRFQAGELDVVSRLSAENFALLKTRQNGSDYQVHDPGASLEYDFLFFNLNDLPANASSSLGRSQSWFRQVPFRQAVSAAIDRDGITRLVYQGHATPLWWQVTPGDKLWFDAKIPRPQRSVERGRDLLKASGFSWRADGALLDPQNRPVKFTIITSASNAQRLKIATLLQDDLKQLGIQASVVPLEFRALMDRVFQTFDYEACVLGLVSGDADPTPDMNVWLSSGGTHVWHPLEKQPATPWEAEIDRLMQLQLTTLNFDKRKALYDRVQELVALNLPIIGLVSPNVLLAARNRLGNFHPVSLNDYALWNVEQIFLRP